MKIDDVHSDSKGRVNLGSQFADQHFLIIIENDRIILEKAVVIPERELWLHKNKEAKDSVLRGLDEAKQGKMKKNAIDLSSFSDV